MNLIKSTFGIFLMATLLLVLSSCNQSVKKVKILPYKALHNNNSKVWILQMQKMDDQDVTPSVRSQKITLTFFKDQTFMVQLLKDFAYYSPNTGSFTLIDGGQKIQFNWKDQSEAVYEIIQLDDDILEYKTLPGEPTQQHLKFIPIDKPQMIDQPEQAEAEINILG